MFESSYRGVMRGALQVWSVFVKFVLRSRGMWSVFVKFVLRSLDSAEHTWLHVFSRVAVVVVAAAADRQTDRQPASTAQHSTAQHEGSWKSPRPQLTDKHVADMWHLVSIPARGITRYIRTLADIFWETRITYRWFYTPTPLVSYPCPCPRL